MGRRPKRFDEPSLVDQLDELELKAARVRRQIHDAIRDGTLSDYDRLRLKNKYRDAVEFRELESAKSNGRKKEPSTDSNSFESVHKKEGPHEVGAS